MTGNLTVASSRANKSLDARDGRPLPTVAVLPLLDRLLESIEQETHQIRRVPAGERRPAAQPTPYAFD